MSAEIKLEILYLQRQRGVFESIQAKYDSDEVCETKPQTHLEFFTDFAKFRDGYSVFAQLRESGHPHFFDCHQDYTNCHID